MYLHTIFCVDRSHEPQYLVSASNAVPQDIVEFARFLMGFYMFQVSLLPHLEQVLPRRSVRRIGFSHLAVQMLGNALQLGNLIR